MSQRPTSLLGGLGIDSSQGSREVYKDPGTGSPKPAALGKAFTWRVGGLSK